MESRFFLVGMTGKRIFVVSQGQRGASCFVSLYDVLDRPGGDLKNITVFGEKHHNAFRKRP